MLSKFSVLGIDGSRWRVRVVERWAFAFLVIVAVRLIIVVAFLALFFGRAFRSIFLQALVFWEKVNENWPAILGGVASVRPLEWYNMTIGVVILSALVSVFVYAVRPLAPLSLMLGNWANEADLHRGNLWALERRLRAALILYGHAAQCERALSARGWVQVSLTNSACLLLQAEREILRAWKGLDRLA
ncbi:hypothetical protein [Streptomyces sp. S.PB5]|uniref:hypothetical protein n=1 Tax=Streptomyces sp. S.PB5 TaxID=3020844 RepID=UPI0025B10A6F|nr:hypothetical protein [Streptomyces sp. S.PB5]MDN3029752.1 hypothetical protein [Streptomyces sp. S.PB5]